MSKIALIIPKISKNFDHLEFLLKHWTKFICKELKCFGESFLKPGLYHSRKIGRPIGDDFALS